MINYKSKYFSKKKTVAIFLGTLFLLLLGVFFFLGRVSVKNKPVEFKQKLPNNQEIQKLQTELNLVRNQLKQSNAGQKKQLESKLSDNTKFILEPKKPDNPKPSPGDRKEGKFRLSGEALNEKG